ncbi:hypothetical protein Syun_026643 [Stephania yunnanensis]|uniref:Kinesin-like protein n=1 Tax=Stephania yunnanensis TaxID=152371 RepID=A0AAP0HSD3_9MAGN
MGRMPATPASKIFRSPATTPGGLKSREEKIFVTVRVRPLSKKECALNDQVAWDCVDEKTISSKHINNDRSTAPYTFDRVFDPTCITPLVYEEGAKDVTLSVLTGINATIFAYGQTSSGKTFTMRGITEHAVQDIYEHIRNTPEREFILKFSALEIYNETIMDLLNRESGPLRVLDDPEKGMVIEKLVEEVAKDSQHLRNLIGVCEAQRQVGETSLNDTSSRSHQIIRLTVESSLRECSGCVKSYIATLNLVDLAGSERASQTNVDGVRLKEGSHINRSLLTLTTVIRKLSDGKRVGHIPYRDSKLTRILQTSLGGNSRTAIICTLSPAQSHMEQSRNTLMFAARAKEVTNSAKVNMIVAEKQLVKHLQKEVARLEAELRSPEPSSPCLKSLLMEKNLKIRKMEFEMEELKRQRDHAQSELELERKIHKKQKVRESRAAENIAKLLTEIKEVQVLSSITEDTETRENTTLKEEIIRLNSQGNTIASLEEKLENVQLSIDKLMTSIKNNESISEPKAQLKKKKILPFSLKNSTNRQHLIRSPCSTHSSATKVPEYEQENISPLNDDLPSSGDKLQQYMKKATSSNREDGDHLSSSEGAPVSRRKNSVNVKKMQEMFKNAAEENIRSIQAYVTELKGRVAKLQYQKQLLVCQVLEMEENEASTSEVDVEDEIPRMPWHLLFEDQRKQILMLWHLCHVSIVHRTQFFLLFRGDPDDQMYVEVELRRLSWLEQQLAEVGNASPALLGDEPAGSVTSSIKALRQEREQLAKRVSSRLAVDELEMLYLKWEIPPGGKQRRLQLVNRLWTDPHSMQHVQDSAEVVARLVGFCETGQQALKEMFALNFVVPSDKKPWMGWNLISNLLHL